MTERWELLELIGQTALRDSDTNLPISTAEAVLDAVEPIISANERERLVRTYDGSAAYAAIAAERDAARATLADLRAKVNECSTVGDVLALLEEKP